MIEVRVPRDDVERVIRTRGLRHVMEMGLLRIDLFPPASGPEVALTFDGDTEADRDRLVSRLSDTVLVYRGDIAHLTVLASRVVHHGGGGPPRPAPGQVPPPTLTHQL